MEVRDGRIHVIARALDGRAGVRERALRLLERAVDVGQQILQLFDLGSEGLRRRRQRGKRPREAVCRARDTGLDLGGVGRAGILHVLRALLHVVVEVVDRLRCLACRLRDVRAHLRKRARRVAQILVLLLEQLDGRVDGCLRVVWQSGLRALELRDERVVGVDQRVDAVGCGRDRALSLVCCLGKVRGRTRHLRRGLAQRHARVDDRGGKRVAEFTRLFPELGQVGAALLERVRDVRNALRQRAERDLRADHRRAPGVDGVRSAVQGICRLREELARVGELRLHVGVLLVEGVDRVFCPALERAGDLLRDRVRERLVDLLFDGTRSRVGDFDRRRPALLVDVVLDSGILGIPRQRAREVLGKRAGYDESGIVLPRLDAVERVVF